MLLVAIVAGLAGLAVSWHWTSLSDWLNVQFLVDELRGRAQSFGWLAAIATVSLASIVAVPLAIIITVSAIAFGPWLGIIYALSGAFIGAAFSFWVGGFLGHEALCRLAGEKVNRLSAKLAERGLMAIVFVRMVPIAPFAIVNMIAGATHIRPIHFLLGTALGMIPGALAITLFADQVLRVVLEPGRETIYLLLIILGLALAGIFVVRRWLARKLM